MRPIASLTPISHRSLSERRTWITDAGVDVLSPWSPHQAVVPASLRPKAVSSAACAALIWSTCDLDSTRTTRSSGTWPELLEVKGRSESRLVEEVLPEQRLELSSPRRPQSG